ncbi:MAG: right-handed parallel beta-helix repeat-containing protein [Actinomycetota bacterium]
MRTTRTLVPALLAGGLVVAACGGDGDGDTTSNSTTSTGTAEATATVDASSSPTTDGLTPSSSNSGGDGTIDGVVFVPGDADTIQAGVDMAAPGEIVLISPGTYEESVDVTTDDITIRGLDRAGVILDGDFALDNGIRALGVSNVAIENLTVQRFVNNGVFWTGVDGYRGSYLTSYLNGEYGIYAFDSVNGRIDNSYASGSAGAGLYVGQCYPCNGLVDSSHAEYNGLGYQGTNSGGDMTVSNSRFNNNRVGIFPNSGSYELCYPQRETVFSDNTIDNNNEGSAPSISFSAEWIGNGIITPGGIGNVIENNAVSDHDRVGIALVPFVERFPNDDLPTESDWLSNCTDAREEPLPEIIPDELVWESFDTVVTGNRVSDSGQADLMVTSIDMPTEDLRNCWSDNVFTTSQPAQIEQLAPCDGEGSGDWSIDAFDIAEWQAERIDLPPALSSMDADIPPPPADLPNMPDAQVVDTD